MKIKAIDLYIETNIDSINNFTKAYAQPTNFGKLGLNFDTEYLIEFQNNFLPTKYFKKTIQSDFQEDLVFIYDRNNNKVIKKDFLLSKETEYSIETQSRDFFSILNYIRFTEDDYGEINLDAREIKWKCEFKKIKDEKIKHAGKVVSARKVQINFRTNDYDVRVRSDMLTNNVIKPNNKFFLWISNDDNLLLKAFLKSSSFDVWWRLEDVNVKN